MASFNPQAGTEPRVMNPEPSVSSIWQRKRTPDFPVHGEKRVQGTAERIFVHLVQLPAAGCGGTLPHGIHLGRKIGDHPFRHIEVAQHIGLEQPDDLPGILPFLAVRNKPLAPERDDDTQDHGQGIEPERLPAFAFEQLHTLHTIYRHKAIHYYRGYGVAGQF